mmetsp:Transcript_243/g.585  ORF Transcript_243/g.585 Transcript_243/m.585 type:complete len:387 (-) Transcript_243:323-1483(-)|eukprot:CAMPEP_0116843980 /NCGR_PEP_ID=MMETSP0418-20121206/12403_1 /TAXON_ID=1158023 /ORGANISM="Astrosyne radiata, Strain 13vi08-1A" /LENGTH=386 /DNA_ID=CAMNT_0004474821 /DNA_START=214 /DNA_END=1374 /DNA_ORIENTATION=+
MMNPSTRSKAVDGDSTQSLCKGVQAPTIVAPSPPSLTPKQTGRKSGHNTKKFHKKMVKKTTRTTEQKIHGIDDEVVPSRPPLRCNDSFAVRARSVSPPPGDSLQLQELQDEEEVLSPSSHNSSRRSLTPSPSRYEYQDTSRDNFGDIIQAIRNDRERADRDVEILKSVQNQPEHERQNFLQKWQDGREQWSPSTPERHQQKERLLSVSLSPVKRQPSPEEGRRKTSHAKEETTKRSRSASPPRQTSVKKRSGSIPPTRNQDRAASPATTRHSREVRSTGTRSLSPARKSPQPSTICRNHGEKEIRSKSISNTRNPQDTGTSHSDSPARRVSQTIGIHPLPGEGRRRSISSPSKNSQEMKKRGSCSVSPAKSRRSLSPVCRRFHVEF